MEAQDQIRTLTTAEEKSKRLDHINDIFMSKYLDLVWFARSNPNQLVGKQMFEVMNSLQKIEEKYPEETAELRADESSWHHGFNSGVLAYARFIASYVEDTLWEVGEDNEDIAENEKVITIEGVNYIEFDGRADAEESFPELDT